MFDIRKIGNELPRRIASVLLATLGDAILSESDPALNLEIPNKNNTFLLGEFNEQVIYNSSCALIVEQSGRSTLSNYQSGSSAEGSAFLQTPIRVRVVWASDAYPSFYDSRLQRDLTQAEFYQYVAELYKGALIGSMYRHVPCEGVAMRVELVSTFAGVDTLRETLRGVALTEWMITSDVSIPLPQRFQDPGSAF